MATRILDQALGKRIPALPAAPFSPPASRYLLNSLSTWS